MILIRGLFIPLILRFQNLLMPLLLNTRPQEIELAPMVLLLTVVMSSPLPLLRSLIVLQSLALLRLILALVSIFLLFCPLKTLFYNPVLPLLPWPLVVVFIPPPLLLLLSRLLFLPLLKKLF